MDLFPGAATYLSACSDLWEIKSNFLTPYPEIHSTKTFAGEEEKFNNALQFYGLIAI